ncbi:MAG: TrkA family potassium uptake protein [Candidatus Dependentiae bacterium]
MKFCVIGLGRLGYQVAVTLAENGMEVMAVDSNESIVASIRDKVTQAICMRVTDEASMRSVGIDEMDVVIVAMGENFAQSILMSALLKKKLEIKKVIARAINDIHKEVLQLVGADQIILPEKQIGIRLADRLSMPFMELIRLTKNFSISHVKAPKGLIGKNVSDAEFFKNWNVRCIGVKQEDEIIPIGPEYIISEGETLIVSGPNDALEKLAKL